MTVQGTDFSHTKSRVSIPNWEAWEITSVMKLTTLSHGTWLWHFWSVTIPTKDYGYAECEYCLLFQPLSH
jgi:hypothetical protein